VTNDDVSPERVEEVEDLLERAVRWARGRSEIVALAVIGSWARGEATDDSDLDLLLLTDVPGNYVERDDLLLSGFVMARITGTRPSGGLTERRLGFSSGLEVEVDVGAPAWAGVDPLDDAAATVAAEGMLVLWDPCKVLAELMAALRGGPRRRG
jgi:uncharacterized protein